MSMKVSIWKVILAFFFAAVLIIGGILIYRAGYVHGAVSDWSPPEGQGVPYFRQHSEHFGVRPFYGHLSISRLFPGLFLGLLCLGILLIMVAVLCIGTARRHLFWEKNGLFDPLNLWEPPPAPEKVKTRDEESDTSSE